MPSDDVALDVGQDPRPASRPAPVADGEGHHPVVGSVSVDASPSGQHAVWSDWPTERPGDDRSGILPADASAFLPAAAGGANSRRRDKVTVTSGRPSGVG